MPDYDQWYRISRSEKIGINVFVESIIGLVYSAVLRPGDVAVDGGANRAQHTEPMRCLVGNSGLVMAFEPVPILAGDLRKRLASASNVRVLEKALGSSRGSSPFVYVKKAHTRSGLKQQLGMTEEMNASIERIQVAMTTLDSEASEYTLLPSIRFLKLDLEGGEYDALRGAEAVMREAQPLIVLENARQKSAEVYEYTPADFFSLFKRLDYQLFDIFGRPFTPDLWSAPAVPPYLIAARRHADVNFVQITLPALIAVLASPYEQRMSD